VVVDGLYAGNRGVAEGLGSGWARQPDWGEPVAIGYGARPLFLAGRGITFGSISVRVAPIFDAMNRAIALHR
jgi:hypothetical protein